MITPVQVMDASVEPSPRSGQFSAVDGRHYMWRGLGPGRGSNNIAVYDPSTELWSLLPTTGPLPPGEYGGCSVCVGRCLYTFGGWDGSSYFNDMSKLDLDTLQWTKVQTSGSQPMKKLGCGLVRVNERTLCCFGGIGIEGTTQPGSTFTKTGLSGGSGWTNEFYFFDTQNGNFYQCVHIRCMHILIGYLATGGRSPTLTHIGNHVHFHINQCYKDDVKLYHSLNCPTPTSRCLVVP